MTIHTYYLTFGFLVPIDKCLEVIGYTVDKLTDELREMINEECCYDDPNEVTPKDWFEYEARNIFNIDYEVTVVGTDQVEHKFILRSFCHDSPDHEKYYVVGLPIGEISRFDGLLTLNETTRNMNLQTLMKPLVEDQNWCQAIQSNSDQCMSYKKKDYGVPNLQYPQWSLIPSVYSTTDDCDCCS